MKKIHCFPLNDEQRAFLTRNYGLLVSYASRVARRRKDLGYDECLGLIHLTAVRAIQCYTPGKYSWSTYLWHQFRSELSHMDAWRGTKSRNALNGTVYLSDIMINRCIPGDQRCITDADDFMDAQLIVAAMKGIVGEEETRLHLRHYIEDETYQALGNELGYTRQRIQQRVTETNTKVRKKLMEEYNGKIS